MEDDKKKIDWYCGETRSLTNNYGTIVYEDTKMDTMQFRTSHSKEGKVALMCPRCKKMTHITVSINNIVTQNTPDNINDFDWYAPVIVTNEYHGMCKYCKEDVHFIEIDEGISLAIEALNEKGYVTAYCCAGHTETDGSTTTHTAYIKFKHKKDIELIKKAIRDAGVVTWYMNGDCIRSNFMDDKQRQEDLLKIVNALPPQNICKLNEDVYNIFILNKDNKILLHYRTMNTLEDAEYRLKLELEYNEGCIGKLYSHKSQKAYTYIFKDGELKELDIPWLSLINLEEVDRKEEN